MLILLFATALTVSTPTAAQASERGPAKPEKKICRYDIETGSIMPGRRTCRTAKEWKTNADKNGEEADRFRRRPQLQANRPIND